MKFVSLPINIILLTILSFIIHWSCIQLYGGYCAPYGLRGFINSIFLSASPFCIFLNYVQFYSIEFYYTSWIIGALSILKLIQEFVSSIMTNKTLLKNNMSSYLFKFKDN